MRVLRRLFEITILSLLVVPACAQEIGVVASLEPRLSGKPPGDSVHVLSVGDPVVHRERLTTGSNGRAQILFVDETTLSVAPRSEIVLDEFVFDPANRRGKFGSRLTQGVLRFIGGRSSDQQPAIIRTPTATIGIRGSSAIVQHVNGRTTAIFLMGDNMCLTTASGQTCVSRRGAVLQEDGYAGQISQRSLAQLLAAIDGAPPARLRRTGQRSLGNSVRPSDPPVTTRGWSTDRSNPLEDVEGRSSAEEGCSSRPFPGGGATGGVFPGSGTFPGGGC